MNIFQEVKKYGTDRANILKNRAVNLKDEGEKLVKQEDVEENFDDEEEKTSGLDSFFSLITVMAWFFAVWVLWNCEKIPFKGFLWFFLLFGYGIHDFAVWVPIAAAVYAYFVQKCAANI